MLKKLFFSLIILVLTSNTLIKQVNAAGELTCIQDAKTKANYANQNDPNLETTVVAGSMFSLVGGLSQVISNNMFEDVLKCTALTVSELGADSGITAGENCATEEDVCASMGLLRKIRDGEQVSITPSGSLMGFASKIENATKEPLPVNLAYYFNQTAKKIPGIKDTVYAQNTVEYGGPFLGAIYHYWTISRNVAYAFLAAAMTIIGVMIIMGKSIDPKAGITVQQALPQIIIALILITFSYPIGAAGASLAYNIRGSLDTSSLIADANKYDVTSVSAIGFWAVLGSFTSGFVAAAAGLVALAISIIMGALVFLKIWGIYLKMLFAILAAPVSFAIGAMPGNSDTTMNWFKQYGSYMLSLPVMSFAAWFVFSLVGDIGIKAVTSFEEFGGWQFGFLAGIATPALTAFGYSIVLTIPDKIDGMFGVKTK